MLWTTEHDNYLMREILKVEPFCTRKNSEKGRCMETNRRYFKLFFKVDEIIFKVDQRSMRERYNLLEKTSQQK